MLTTDKKHLEIFNNTGRGIKINKNLPKYIVLKKHQDELANKYCSEYYKSKLPVDSDNLALDKKAQEEIRNITINLAEAFDKETAHDFNIILNTKDFKDKFKLSLCDFNSFEISMTNSINDNSQSDSKFNKFIKKITRYFKNIDDEKSEEFYEIDILQFFDFVKLETEDSKEKYKNRIKEYMILLKQCDVMGQTSMKEKLFQNIIINKYESILYAHGYQKLITEEKLVEFVKKSEKGLSLTYIDNYTKIIPLDITQKVIEANKLEVFDNYCILHYDPDKKSYQQTQEDIKKENQKRRDPILFGMIKNSNKLYFIGDWIDEYCDLTFDKIIDIIGKELIEKDYLVDKIDLKM